MKVLIAAQASFLFGLTQSQEQGSGSFVLNEHHVASQDVIAPYSRPNGGSSKIYKIPLEWTVFGYTTNIAFGTPPQPFVAAVDMTYGMPMSLSIDCASCAYDEDHWLYNSSQSSSYVAIGTEHEVEYGGARYPGHLSQDTLHLTALQVQDQVFHEAVDLEPTGWKFDFDFFDGILGLSRPSVRTEAKSPSSFLENIVSQKLVDSNVVSLKVPAWEDFNIITGGEILFGGIDESYHSGDFTYLQLTNETNDPALTHRWTVDANSANLKGIIKESLKGFSAIIDLAIPFIALPAYFINDMMYLLGAEEFDDYIGEFWAVPCTKLDSLPNFTITLSGKEFHLTPEEYTKKFEDWDGTSSCMLAFTPLENYLGSNRLTHKRATEVPEKPAVILGAWFLQKYYTVLDIDRSRVGFAKLKEPTEAMG